MPTIKPDEAGFSPERLARISAVFRDHVARGRINGAVTLVSRFGKIAHFDAVGLRDKDSGDPLTVDALFRIYSMTKPIVSTMVMMLLERGELLLTDPVSKFIPAFAHTKVAVPGEDGLTLVEQARPMTVQDLLRHTSGLSYEFLAVPEVQKLYIDARIFRRNWTSAEHAEALAALPLNSQPGSSFDYGRSTDILGRIIEVITGSTLGDALREHIFDPLDMADTDFHVPADKAGRLAWPLPNDPDTGAPVKLLDALQVPQFESGGGGLISSATDYARFIQMIQNGGVLGHTRLLSRKTVQLMASDHLEPGTAILSDLLPPGHGFGLGFAVRTSDGLASSAGTAGQFFWSGIAGTTFWIDPEEEMFALLMIQVPPEQREEYRHLFRNLVHGAFGD